MSPRRIAIVTTQLLGFDAAGGVGAATTSLALALARSGHDVDVLYVKDRLPQPLDPEWGRRYEEVGSHVRHVARAAVAVEPASFWRLRAVELALRDDPPDVVIAHEYGAPAYIAQRLRQLGLGFQNTLFTYCHGTGPWVKEVTGNALISPEMLAHAPLEQAAAELADLVVSPSAYLLGWMEERGWRMPETRVIPLLPHATAMGRSPSRDGAVDRNGRVERLVYFGRLEERKGIGPFVAALNTLPTELLTGIELEFLGGRSKQWDPCALQRTFPNEPRAHLRRSPLRRSWAGRGSGAAPPPGNPRRDALARGELAQRRLRVPGRQHSVHCEYGRRNRRARCQGRPRTRAVEPTVDGISTALQQALSGGDALRSVRPAFDPAEALSAWEAVVATDVRPAQPGAERPLVDVIRPAGAAPALDAQTYERTNVIRSLQEGSAEWVVFLDDGDVPSPQFVDVLVRAQAASRADVVSCALVHDGRERYFLGDPGGVAACCRTHTGQPR